MSVQETILKKKSKFFPSDHESTHRPLHSLLSSSPFMLPLFHVNLEALFFPHQTQNSLHSPQLSNATRHSSLPLPLVSLLLSSVSLWRHCMTRERESQLEAQRLKDLEALRKAHSDEASKWRKEVQLMRDAFQRKAASLCQMLEEYRRKYEEREPRREDVQLIADLQQALEEKERDLSALTEEKRYYQLELAKHEGGSNCNSEVTIEIPARRRKGCKTDNAHGVSASNARGAKSGRLDTQLVDKGPQVNVCRGSSAGGLATTSRTPPVTLKESSVQPLAARRGSSPALPTRPTGGIYQHPGIEATANNVNDQLPNHNRPKWNLTSILKTLALR